MSELTVDSKGLYYLFGVDKGVVKGIHHIAFSSGINIGDPLVKELIEMWRANLGVGVYGLNVFDNLEEVREKLKRGY